MIRGFSNFSTVAGSVLKVRILYRGSMVCTRMPPPPIVAICGSTGTGKSKLAVELGSVMRGEIVNADAIQLYTGLPIATNKITATETAGVPHHLLGVLDAGRTNPFDVHKFRSACLPVLERILDARHLPILVGGTHYYIEAVLWSDFSAPVVAHHSDGLESLLLPQDNSECYTKLQRLCPTLAARLDPRNSRKVRAALHRLLVSCDTPFTDAHSEVPTNCPPNRSYVPRYPGQTIIIWLYCDQPVLNSRLDARVDDMLQQGLIQELDDFLESLCGDSNFSDPDFTSNRSGIISDLFTETEASTSNPFNRRGILQSIGFKEFADYLSMPPNSSERNSPFGEKILREAVARTKIATRQYARRQTKWIINRFLRRPYFGSLPVYRLDVTEALHTSSTSTWTRDVLAPACRIVHDYMLHTGSWTDDLRTDPSRLHTLLNLCPACSCPTPCAVEPPSEVLDDTEKSDNTTYVCSTCDNRVFYRLVDFEAHNQSRGHQKRLTRLRKLSLLQSVVSLTS